MSAVVKMIATKKVPDPESLTHSLRWWLRICFIVGLPLSKPNYGFRVKLFSIVLLIGDISIWTIILTYATHQYLKDITGLITKPISTIVSYYNAFLGTSVLHVLLVWKLNECRAVIRALDLHITVDSKLKKYLQIITALMVLFLTLTLAGGNAFTVMYGSFRIFDESPSWTPFLWVCRSSVMAYPIIASLTITALITALGYQFTLLKEAMTTESFITWEKLYERHALLCKLCGELQQCFDLPILILFGSNLVRLCMNGFQMVEAVMSNKLDFLPVTALFVSETCLRCICLCTAADYLTDQAKSVSLELAEADLNYLHTNHSKEIILRFSANVRNLEYLTRLSVGGFCPLGKPLLLAMLAAVLTYFVLLCQIKAAESGSSH